MGRKETEEAIADSRAGRVTRVGSVAELVADLNADDESTTRHTMAELLAASDYSQSQPPDLAAGLVASMTGEAGRSTKAATSAAGSASVD